MNYQWSFSNLMVAATQGNLSSVMVSVKIRLAAVDGGNVAYHKQSISFAPADPSAFVALERITESQMISFVEQALGNELITIKSELANRIDNSIAEQPLPWLHNETSPILS
jgi:hypothetical protein